MLKVNLLELRMTIKVQPRFYLVSFSPRYYHLFNVGLRGFLSHRPQEKYTAI